MIIRQETHEDHKPVSDLIERAFRYAEYSDHKEQLLVERSRKSETFIPELSLVAEEEGNLTGHILFSRIFIYDGRSCYKSLALAPVSVLPDYQGKGIGSLLIRKGHSKCIAMGFKSIVQLGHPGYYPRLGYKNAAILNILRLKRFAKFVLRNLLIITESNQLCFANLLRFSILFCLLERRKSAPLPLNW